MGVNNASVFPGFCSKHDTMLFKSIEGKTLSLTKDTAFLFSYRAIAYERFAKEAQLRNTDIQREADRGHPFWKQAMIQTHLAAVIDGIKIGMRDMDLWKNQLDERLLSGKRDDFHFVAVRFDQVLPWSRVAHSTQSLIFWDRGLQQLARAGVDFDHVTLTVTTFEAQTIVVFGWIGSDNGPPQALADSFAAVEDTRKADALVRLLFIHTDNLFIRPSWWEALPESHRRILNEMTLSGTTMRIRSGVQIANDATSFLAAGVVEVVTG